MNELEQGATAPDIQSGSDVMNAQVFGDIWAYIMENYTESDGVLTEAYIALRGVCAILEKELNIERMEVSAE